MDAKDAKDGREILFTTPEDRLSHAILGAALAVHSALGPGLLESVYEACLFRELTLRGLGVRRQCPLPVHYRGVRLECGYRLDLLVEERVIVELKAMESILDIHLAQALTYLKLSGHRLCLVLNFNVPHLRDGIHRVVHGLGSSSSSRPLR